MNVDGSDARMSEAHHRIKNSLQLVASLLSRQARSSHDQHLRQQLSEASARVSAVARLHQHLTDGPGLPVDLTAFLKDVCNDLLVATGCQARGVGIEVDGDRRRASSDEAMTVGLIVNELATNAIKHAYAERGGQVRVRISSRGRGYRVVVEDDGPGMGPSPQHRTGQGLAFVERLVLDLKGQLSLRSGSGGGALAEVVVPRSRRWSQPQTGGPARG